MDQSDLLYKLDGSVELDECYFSTEVSEDQKDEPLKHGRDSQRKTKVLVMAETIDPIASQSISSESTIVTDDSSSYTNFHKMFKEHHSQVIPKDQIGKVLPWVHIAISNAKRTILDIFHDVKPEYLQSHLNEFCFKFNRRNFRENLFDSMLTTAIKHKNYFRYNIA